MAKPVAAINEIILTTLRYRLERTGMWYLVLDDLAVELGRRIVDEMWPGISRNSLINVIDAKVRGLELIATQPTRQLISTHARKR